LTKNCKHKGLGAKDKVRKDVLWLRKWDLSCWMLHMLPQILT